jgi:hypothetical protein
MEEIALGGGGGLDFCFIDTVHTNPGELLDVLMILPFLNDNALIVFHDVNCHTGSGKFPECNAISGITNNLLFSAITGKKYIQGNFISGSPYANWEKSPYFPNIGAIKINNETKKHIFEIFNLLTLKWAYLPSKEEEKSIINFSSKYYEDYFVEYLKKVFSYHRKCSEHEHTETFTTTFLIRQIMKNLLGEKLTAKIRKALRKSKP